jgi:hypothetical protein
MPTMVVFSGLQLLSKNSFRRIVQESKRRYALDAGLEQHDHFIFNRNKGCSRLLTTPPGYPS